MSRLDLGWVCRKLTLDGWRFETDALDDFALIASRNGEVKHIDLPRRVLIMSGASDAFDNVLQTIEGALGLGRYVTTPVVAPSPQWSPYP